MKPSYIPALFVLAAGALASLHNVAVCVQNRSYSWGSETYTIDTAATQCACDYYKNRHTGNNWWDVCPDCWFDGTYCNSAAWHIGGDEMTYYCSNLCNSEGAEANPSNLKSPPS